MRFSSQLLSASLASLLAVGPMPAQSGDMAIRVLDSDGAQLLAGSHASKGFFVQVTDGSGAPVSEAAVVLRLPESGPTGAFADGSHSAVAYTDAAGKAHIADVQWGSEAGVLTIKITATKGVVHTGTLLEESIVPAAQGATVVPRLVTAVPTAAKVEVQSPVPPAVSPQALPPAITASKPPELPSSLTIPVTEPVRPGTPAPSSSPLPSAHIAPALAANPSVSVTNNLKGEKVHSGSSKTKWIILVAVVAGAGAGVAMMGGHGKKSTPAATPGITIGSPTVSVGAP